MAFNKENAKNALASGGIPFLPENLDNTKTFKEHLEAGKVYNLGRVGVVKETKRFDQAFAAVELNGEFYTGYATAVSNQIIALIATEVGSGNVEGMINNERVAYSEGAAEIKVKFERLKSQAGEYWSMLFAE